VATLEASIKEAVAAQQQQQQAQAQPGEEKDAALAMGLPLGLGARSIPSGQMDARADPNSKRLASEANAILQVLDSIPKSDNDERAKKAKSALLAAQAVTVAKGASKGSQ
ncbi:unnamed protein product, partial [Prorocentrum cordatum]